MYLCCVYSNNLCFDCAYAVVIKIYCFDSLEFTLVHIIGLLKFAYAFNLLKSLYDLEI